MKRYSEVLRNFKEEIKSFLIYFVMFEKDDKIWLKKYPIHCTVGDLDWQAIIIITYDKYKVFANDSHQKIWILKGHNICCPKWKSKGIIVFNFFLLKSWVSLLAFLSK